MTPMLIIPIGRILAADPLGIHLVNAGQPKQNFQGDTKKYYGGSISFDELKFKGKIAY